MGWVWGGGQHVGVPSERGEPSGSPDPLPHNFFFPPPRDSKSRARLRAAPGARPLLPAQGGGRRLERPPRRGEDGTGHRGPPPCAPRSCASPRGFGKNRDLLAGRGPGAPPPPPLGPGRGRAPRLQPPAVRSREPPGCWPGKCPCAGPPPAKIVPLNLGSVFGALRLPSRRRKGKIKTSPGSVNRIVPRPPGARATRRAARSFLGVSPAAGTPG